MPNNTEAAIQKAYALTVTENRSLNATVRTLANLVNEHTLILFALCKHLKTTPEALVALVKDDDFIEPNQNKIETA